MSTLTQRISKRSRDLERKPQIKTIGLIQRYVRFIKTQQRQSFLWYAKIVLVIPNVIMVPTIIAMSMAVDNYIWFVALAMLLFFANIIAHIADLSSRYFIPLYHFSIALMILIPLIAHLVKL